MVERRSPYIASVSKAFTVLSTVASRESVSAKHVAETLGSPLPTTYHMLNTLVAEGALVKSGSRGYRLGPTIGMLSDAYLEQGEPVAMLEGSLKELADVTGETAYVSAWHNGEIEVVATAEGSHAVRVMQLQRGAHGYAHARASGKLLLAFARPGLREQYLREHPLERRTKTTIVEPDCLQADFDAIRERGYSTDLEEFSEDVSCIAVPVLVGDRIIAALTVSCPTSRFERSRDTLVTTALGIARSAERALLDD
ncbi:IclR family transcriptional regulator [Rhodococcus sp. 114MFTsu3.1]|uniref:IclR family transcriptional regulator n=1 Tax=Rhodococcus sp. 114MFTsu3.1 TaxID=1172184 RepID=UPI00068895ED|nr:IclR family transcriptional regulator [Rhodococcus sp. 114MFTsu3.1]